MQLQAYSVGELEALPLIPGLDYNQPNRIPYFFDVNHHLFTGNVFPSSVIGQLAQMKKAGSDLSEVPVYKLCRDAQKQGLDQCYFHISEFELSDSKAVTWLNSLTANRYANRVRDKRAMMEKNKPFIRMHMMGDPSTPIRCTFDDLLIDGTTQWGVVMNNMQGHHCVVVNGESLHKDVTDPGELLSTLDFTQVSGKTTKALDEITKVVFLGPSAHERIHKATNAMPDRSSDITNYTVSERPWSLRSESNWNQWCDFRCSFGYERPHDFQAQMQELTLPRA